MDEENKNETLGNDIVSMEMFVHMIYQDYIMGPIINKRGPITQNRMDNHQRILETWKQTNPEKYQEGLQAMKIIQELIEDKVALQEFEKRRKTRMPFLTNLARHINRNSEYNFERLEDESLISSKGLDPLATALFKQKYGDRIVIVDGKAEYYIEDESKDENSTSEIISNLGERLTITPKGTLHYHTAFGAKDWITAYQIMKQEGEYKIETLVFSKIMIPQLRNQEYVNLVANYLLSSENLILRNYGGYIGEIEKTSITREGEAMPIHRELQDGSIDSSYSISYDPTALTAAQLFARQRDKDLTEKLTKQSQKETTSTAKKSVGEER